MTCFLVNIDVYDGSAEVFIRYTEDIKINQLGLWKTQQRNVEASNSKLTWLRPLHSMYVLMVDTHKPVRFC